MIFTRNLQQTRKRSGITLNAMPYLLRNVLINEQNGNVLALRGEAVKRGLDGVVVRLGVHDEEVLLRVGRWRYVLYGGREISRVRKVGGGEEVEGSGGGRTPTPARSMPVTVSCWVGG